MTYLERSRPAKQVLGLVLIVAIVAAVVLVVLEYNNKLSPGVRATVVADRSGLGMVPDAPVTLRGITVGHVRDIALRDGRAAIGVAFDADKVRYIASNVTAQITQPTLFGAKGIDLIAPASPASARIAEGGVIQTDAIVTEGNSVLEHLNTVLTKVDVPKLSSGLGALSTALQGRGAKLGDVITQVNTYLKDFNPSLPQLNDDLASAATVTNIYADFTPDLVDVLGNLTVTSNTVVDQKDQLHTLFTRTTTTADNVRTLLEDNKKDLHRALDVLDPTTALLARYSPEFPCLFTSLNQFRIDFQQVSGGVVPGVRTWSEFVPASDGYRYPRDLPKVGKIRTKPSCFGGPIDPKDVPFPHVIFDDGWGGFVQNDGLTVNNPLPTAPAALPSPLAAPLASPLSSPLRVADPAPNLLDSGPSRSGAHRPPLPPVADNPLGGLGGVGGGR